ADLPLEDRWILSRVNAVAGAVNQLLADFQLGEAARQIHDFLWGEYCDWYIEAAKVRLGRGDASPLPVLAQVLAIGLKLMHPFAPFVTEVIWQSLVPHLSETESEALIVAPYPEPDPERADAEAERTMNALTDAVRAARNIRAEKGVDPKRFVEGFIVVEESELRALLAARGELIEALGRLRPLHVVASADAPSHGVARDVLEASTVLLPMQGMVDLDAERGKLRKELDAAQSQEQRLVSQLGNAGFRVKAPAQVVGKLEDDLRALRGKVSTLKATLEDL
ncbi:MAG: class I tRNA ligase family protein, partial [Dehalococcoidia bacterium]